jgi:hypothetical protein
MMEIIAGLILLAAVFGVLAYPLYRARPRAIVVSTGTLNDLLAKRDGLYESLRDLDLDFQLGKLDNADYQLYREKYLGRAAVALQQLDALRGADVSPRDLSDEIEREIAALRRRPTTDNGRKQVVNTQRSSVMHRRSSCPRCKRRFQPGDRYCTKCGRILA